MRPRSLASLLTLSLLTLAGALGLAPAVARAADPSTPRIGPEQGPRAKVDAILRALPEAEAAPWRQKLAAGTVPARDLLHHLLVERIPAYKAAVATFDREGTNAEELEKLGQSDAGALTPVLRAHAAYFEGRARLNRDEFDVACQCFDRVRRELSAGSTWIDEATFYLGYAYARRPELEEDREQLWKKRAKHCFESLAPDFGGEAGPTKSDSDRSVAGVSERDREASIWLLRELRGEGSGPLLELARRMDTIQRSIDREHTGKPIQKKQQAVIGELDRLIELLREKEQGGGGGGGGGKGGGKKPGGNGGQNAGAPAGRSSLPSSGLQPGSLEGKPKVMGSSDWGNLPEKEREAVLQALKEKFPERYKEIVEQYMKSISDDAGGKKSPSTPKPETPAPPEKK